MKIISEDKDLVGDLTIIKYPIRQIESIKGIATINNFLKINLSALVSWASIRYLCIKGAPISGNIDADISPIAIGKLNCIS